MALFAEQVRSRKQLTYLQREQAWSQDDCEVERAWPFWRKKNKAELKARALTKRIVESSKKQQLDQVTADVSLRAASPLLYSPW